MSPKYEFLGKWEPLPGFTQEIIVPPGTTHAEYELDYSGCCYESDPPQLVVRFYKKV